MVDDGDTAQSRGDAEGNGAEPDSEQTGDVRLLLNTHYVKDFSFENPHAPQIYGELSQGPNINVNIDVELNHLRDRLYEIVVAFNVKATLEEKVVFLVELHMGGLATVGRQVPGEQVNKLLLTEVPRHVFPFARAIISDATRDGGFPPLLINPINFDDLYRKRQTAQSEGDQAEA